ncbi:MAG: hypothetical protein AAGK04_09305 [Planctomycetota bacterium]
MAASVEAGAYTDLGTPPTLALARFGHLSALDRLRSLAEVEATRLASEGDVASAIDVMGDVVFLGRQLADRQFAEETRWGLETMSEGLERIRSLLYADFIGSRSLDQEAIQAAIDRLDPDRGYLDLGRLDFPEGDRVAVEQIVSRVFGSGDATDAATFAATLARLDAGDRPLRLFGQAAAWEGKARGHASAPQTRDELRLAYEDWVDRWAVDPFHPRMSDPAYYNQLDGDRYAALSATLEDRTDLFSLRERARLDIVGTRTSLALVGYVYARRSPPPKVSSVRGSWVRRLDADPFRATGGATGGPPLEYFVPIRDTADQFPNGEPQPHEIEVMVGGSSRNIRVGRDGFVLYSIGPDGQKDWARRVARWEENGVGGTDLLIWPPILALERGLGAGE